MNINSEIIIYQTEEGLSKYGGKFMQVKIIFYNVVHNVSSSEFLKSKECIMEFNGDTTIKELFERAGEPFADLSEYYYLSRPYALNSSCFPYIINSNGKVCWDIYYEKATVLEFLYTHDIEDRVLEAKTGYTQAGGPGFLDISQIWSAIYPIIDQFVNVVGLISIIGSAGKWVHSLCNKKEISPQSYFDFIFSRNKWNHFELAEHLDINYEDAKQLLKILGYTYDRSKMIYNKQPCSDELREKLSKINVLDI